MTNTTKLTRLLRQLGVAHRYTNSVTELQVILALSYETATVQQLENLLVRGASSLYPTFEVLKKNGLITREARLKSYELTPTGTALVQDILNSQPEQDR